MRDDQCPLKLNKMKVIEFIDVKLAVNLLLQTPSPTKLAA